MVLNFSRLLKNTFILTKDQLNFSLPIYLFASCKKNKTKIDVFSYFFVLLFLFCNLIYLKVPVLATVLLISSASLLLATEDLPWFAVTTPHNTVSIPGPNWVNLKSQNKFEYILKNQMRVQHCTTQKSTILPKLKWVLAVFNKSKTILSKFEQL